MNPILAGVVLCGVAFAAPLKKPEKATKDQLKAMRSHMKAGWAAQHDKRWADAVKEFEAALKVMDGDARALSELGWSAMNAGDFAKAKVADLAAVSAAADPKIEAASLYNLGLVQERLGDTAGAMKSFARSISLRPNKTVGDELAKIGGKPDVTPPFCTPDRKICDCLADGFIGDVDKCEASTTVKSPVPGWTTYTVESTRETTTYLVDEHRELVGQLADDIFAGRHDSHMDLEKSELKQVGGHQVYWLETTDTETSQTMDENLVTDSFTDTSTTTVCAVGDKKTPTKCFSGPSRLADTITKSKIDDSGNQKDAGTTVDESVMTFTLADDGTLTVKLASGKLREYPPAIIGPHKLW
ncbi:MAG: tetratricopeptide repeat protein [Kofleriaceae bacterium]